MVFETFIRRENTIFGILNKFIENKLNFVVVGDYGVSAFKHRFSVDVDLVIKKQALHKFEEILKNNKFEKIISKKLDNIYSSEFVRYTKKQELPVSIDLLIGGVASRKTGAVFSFELIAKYSKKRKIIGIEKEVTPKVASREMLIITKLHSGRLTDFRDVAALCKNCNHELIKKIIYRGNIRVLTEHIKIFMGLLSNNGFIDSFKGVFVEKKFDLDVKEISKLNRLI